MLKNELQGNAQKVVDKEKEMQGFQGMNLTSCKQTKDEEQVTRAVCSMARRTPRAVEEALPRVGSSESSSSSVIDFKISMTRVTV